MAIEFKLPDIGEGLTDGDPSTRASLARGRLLRAGIGNLVQRGMGRLNGD